MHVTDRFGDYGLCGVMVFHVDDRSLIVDAFLLSCRALGRGVEHAMLAALGREAGKRGATEVVVVFVETDKNRPAETFLQGVGGAIRRLGDAKAFAFDARAISTLAFVPPEHEARIDSTSRVSAIEAVRPANWTFLQAMADGFGFLAAPAPVNVEQPAASARALTRVEDIVAECVRNCLPSKPSEIDRARPFSEYGVDSFTNIKLVVTLNQAFGIVLPPTTLFDYVCVEDLSAYIASAHGDAVARLIGAAERAEHARTASPAPKEAANEAQGIAVIGLACRLPGATHAGAFWDLLRSGGSCISEVPPSRWDIDAFWDPDPSRPDKTYGRHGGFLEDIDCFDASFFGISGREARQMDPQQRAFLEEAWRALEDAGYAGRGAGRKNWGVFAGADSGDYQAHLRKAGAPLDPSAFLGNDASILAARIAYFMNMTGPALTIDTASSSSLAAVHLACESLRRGETDMALAGGVSIHVTPTFHILCSKAGMLAADGACKVFDDDADGFVPGEAAGVVVLKRLAEARADGDHIYAVIRGSAMNQDGRTNGITAPSSLSQTQLIRDLYRKAGVDPAEIGYVEAHGTGTKLGDPVEVKALTDAFREFTSQRQGCAIGSVKSHIGHCTHASGVCGLLALTLALHHRMIPPSINFSTPNRHIDFENSPFFVNTGLRDWAPNARGGRIGALSSFGFSGTNVHMVVEAAPERERDPARALAGEGPELFVFSARSDARLMALARQWRDFLAAADMGPAEFRDVAFTLQTAREAMSHRLAVAARDVPELIARLDAFLRDRTSPECFVGVAQAGAVADHDSPGSLAQSWVRGAAVDWSRLGGRDRRRVGGLPGYPFEKDRYWLPRRKCSSPNLLRPRRASFVWRRSKALVRRPSRSKAAALASIGSHVARRSSPASNLRSRSLRSPTRRTPVS